MARRPENPLIDGRYGAEGMLSLSEGDKSLQRGRRAQPRTEVCRPCLAWLEDSPDHRLQGVLLDVTPYGMRMRALEHFPKNGVVVLQMMRDDQFRYPLSGPIRAKVVYVGRSLDGFVDHGLQRLLARIRKPEEFRRPNLTTPRVVETRRARMYSIELGGPAGTRRWGRNRG